jgi:hypothetical protein
MAILYRDEWRPTAFAVLLGATSLMIADPAFAQGSNTSTPAPTPPTPPSVTTSAQVINPFDATCSQQLTTIGIVAEAGGLAAEVAAQLAASGPPQQAAEGIALGLQAVALGNQILGTTLPSCEQAFTGTVSVSAGGVNVTGGSLFTGNVGVAGDVAVSGNVTASQFHATQGISAMGGRISLGDPNGVTFSDGITLGGGALSGAGFGGPQASTGHFSAIAIGNGASAFSANSMALGSGARANGANATAIGTNANAGFAGSVALGPGSLTTRPDQVVLGSSGATVTMPGLTSAASRAAQSGLLQVTTTDSAGNLAADSGATFKGIARVQAGVAVAMAASPPHLNPGQRFGVRAGYGGFAGLDSTANAFGVSAAGLMAHGLLSQHDRLTADLGFGIGSSQFMGYQQNNVIGVRAGMQYTW